MTRFLTFKRLSILFVALFAVSVGGVFAFQSLWLGPERECTQTGRWWYPEERRCLTPIYLPDITGRPAGQTRAEASAQKNRELVEIEHGLAAEENARAAATESERERIAALMER